MHPAHIKTASFSLQRIRSRCSIMASVAFFICNRMTTYKSLISRMPIPPTVVAQTVDPRRPGTQIRKGDGHRSRFGELGRSAEGSAFDSENRATMLQGIEHGSMLAFFSRKKLSLPNPPKLLIASRVTDNQSTANLTGKRRQRCIRILCKTCIWLNLRPVTDVLNQAFMGCGRLEIRP